MVSSKLLSNLLTKLACSATGPISESSVENLTTSSPLKFPEERRVSKSIFRVNILSKLYFIDLK